MTYMLVNYNHSIVNIPATLLKHYGLASHHASLPMLENELKNDYDHVVLMVLDGFGTNLLPYLTGDDLLKKHHKDTLRSTFPPTTVAATTSLLTGLTPYETGHLGWFQYVKPFNTHYTVFLQEDYYDHRKAIHEDLRNRFTHERVLDRIAKTRDDLSLKHFFPWPIDKQGYRANADGFDALLMHLSNHDKTLSYFYSIDPDMTQHKNGIKSDATKNVVQTLNDQITDFYHAMPDNTLILITADHGLVDVEPMKLLDDDVLNETYEVLPANEPRATTFFIKEDKHEQFVSRFNERFGKYFDLHKTETLLEKKLFGFGTRHALIEESLGDYMAIATDRYYLELTDTVVHKGHHAGSLDDEMNVPLIYFSKKGTSL